MKGAILQEAKLLALGVPFAKSYKFDEDWKKQKNGENTMLWKEDMR